MPNGSKKKNLPFSKPKKTRGKQKKRLKIVFSFPTPEEELMKILKSLDLTLRSLLQINKSKRKTQKLSREEEKEVKAVRIRSLLTKMTSLASDCPRKYSL
jgi:hypothetical protein